VHITIIGTGYVGLVTGTCFAEMGNHVTCIDINQEKVERLHRGDVPIYEPGLKEMMQSCQQAGLLHFSTQLPDALMKSQLIFIAVGTPPDEDGSADLSQMQTLWF